jgi:hypothetical protein
MARVGPMALMLQASSQVSAKPAAPLNCLCNLFWRYDVARDQARVLQLSLGQHGV